MGNSNRILTIVAILAALAITALGPGEVQGASSAEITPPPGTLTLWRPGDPGQPLRISGWVRSTVRIADSDSQGARQVRIRLDGLDGADDIPEDPGIGDQVFGQLHRLLVGDGAGDGVGLPLAAGNTVDGLNALLRHG